MCLRKSISCCALLFSFACAGLPSQTLPKSLIPNSWENLAFRIDDSSCFVGIAPVYLSVSKLEPEGKFLTGTYEIRVPLKKSKNDSGKIVLPLNVTAQELEANGGILRGKAISVNDSDKPHRIVCEVHPDKDQLIRLFITTPDRTVKFKSRYEIVRIKSTDS